MADGCQHDQDGDRSGCGGSALVASSYSGIWITITLGGTEQISNTARTSNTVVQ